MRYWRSLRLLLSTQLKTTNRSIFDWWHRSVNIIEKLSHTISALHSTYLEYEAFAKETGSTSMVMRMRPVFFGGNSDAKGIWNHGSPLLWKSNHVSPSTS
ncbi:hypothetical protein ACLB1O_16845 [Escherichia coli]